MKRIKKLVVAKTYKHFECWCSDNNENKNDYSYISTPEQLRGRKPELILYLDEWWVYKDYSFKSDIIDFDLVARGYDL